MSVLIFVNIREYLKILIFIICAYSIYEIQPLDVTFYGPFKTYYSQACDNWTTNHPGRAVTEGQIPGLVRTAYEKAATQHIARKGFLETGIYPYNPDVFSESDFAPSLTSDRPPAAATPNLVDPQVTHLTLSGFDKKLFFLMLSVTFLY